MLFKNIFSYKYLKYILNQYSMDPLNMCHQKYFY